MNNLTEKEKGREGRKSSVTPSVLGDEVKTIMTMEGEEEAEREKTPTELVKVDEEEADKRTVVAGEGKGTRDSLVESLLEDSDVEMTGV